MSNLCFIPHPLTRNRHLQTLISGLKPKMDFSMVVAEEKQLLNIPVDGGVKLLGAYSCQTKGNSKGLVLLIHGWLGCITSNYIMSVGEHLFRQGYAIFRLNLRDHGGTEALNEGAFHTCRLEEVFQAAHQIASLQAEAPFFMAGFSMGGNFVLRMAQRHSQQPIPNLQHVISVSPTINPRETMRAVDRFPWYKYYFLRRWRRNMLAKQAAFPHIYKVNDLITINNNYDLSEIAIPRYTGFPDSESYYQVYGITPAKIKEITVPTTIITAEDDPIIPSTDFKALMGINPHVSVLMQPYGGHVGFIHFFPKRYWLGEAIANILR